MQIIGVARLGRDAELRYTPESTPVANLSLAFTYGRKGQDVKRPTQWVDASLWGKLAEALHPYLIRGQQVYVVCKDGHIENFTRTDQSMGNKLVAEVTHIELVGSAPQDAPAAPAPRQAAAGRQAPASRGAPPARPAPAARQAAPSPSSGFDDMDDDIPFVTASMHYDMTTSKARRMARYGK